MKDIIDELLYDIARERDLEHQSLLIKDCAKKLNNIGKKNKTYPLPKNIFISSGIVPTAYFEIALPQHMVKIEFISKSGDLVDFSFNAKFKD